MLIYITGDTHGEYGRICEIARMFDEADDEEKYLIVCGDFGYLLKNNFDERKLLDEIEKKDFKIIVIPGNHENYAEIMNFDTVDFNGAKAFEVRKNILYIKRGEIFELGGNSFFCMGGGYSIDRYMRTLNYSYWSEEMPTDGEYKYAVSNIEKYRDSGKKIDYIVSHTAPESGLFYLGKSHGEEEQPLNNFLEYVREELSDEVTMHYYGHLHMDKEMPAIKQRVLWFDYVKIEEKR